MSYSVKHTDPNKGLITIQDSSEDMSTDIVLFGRKRLEYGQAMNSNLLHILENFACQAKSIFEEFPDVDQAFTIGDTAKKLLSTPIDGQLWYNKTINRLYVYDANRMLWNRLASQGDIAISSGTILNHEIVPIPESDGGDPFDHLDCVWIVSANNLPAGFESVICVSDPMTREVTSEYTVGGSTFSTPADYFIVAIRGNINMGAMPDILDGGDTPPMGMSLAVASSIFNESIGFGVGDTVGLILEDGNLYLSVNGDKVFINSISHNYVKITSDLSSSEFVLTHSSNVGPYVQSDGEISYLTTNTSSYALGRIVNFVVYGANKSDGTGEEIIGQVEFRVI